MYRWMHMIKDKQFPLLETLERLGFIEQLHLYANNENYVSVVQFLVDEETYEKMAEKLDI